MNIDLLRKIDRIHPYPAKFTIDLALEYIEKYTSIGDVIYDPFVGSGTTLLAASVLGRSGYGTDINHIAILISQFKLLKLSDEEMQELSKFVDNFEATYQSKVSDVELFHYQSINHWFCDDSIRVLSLIKKEIYALNGEDKQLFCNLVFSAIINTVSNQESDTRYAAIEKPNMTVENIASVFINKFRTTLEIFKQFNDIDRTNGKCTAKLLDSKLCGEVLSNNSVDLIFTSSPYVNTYDYYLYHKHRMKWLEYDFRFSMETEIGSRREFSSLKREVGKFNLDLFEIYNACDKVLKKSAKIVLVMGDGKVAGKIYDAKENMIDICSKLNWKLIDYSYSLLDDTSRSFQQSYRTKGKKEHILTFEKV